MTPIDETFFFSSNKIILNGFLLSDDYKQKSRTTVKHVGLYIPKHALSHDHFYIAVSRVTSSNCLKIACTDEVPAYVGYRKKIMCYEIFDNIM